MTTPAPKRSWLAPLLIGGGGLLTIGATIFAVKKSSNTVRDIEKAVDAPPVALPLTPAAQANLPTFKARLTGYWPFTARPDEMKMEGGVFDRMMPKGYKDKPDSPQYKAHVLHTVEQHLANPIAHPFVSLSGDDAAWPYAQKILIPWNDGKVIVGRVVDTGSHFRGLGKLVRVAGYEPLDVCVQSSQSVVPKLVTAKIVPGDSFVSKKGPQQVVTSRLADSSVRLSGDEVVREGNTPDDYEALARMVESETGGHTLEEQHAAAWTTRNRAADLGLTLHELLAPSGKYGSPQQSGGYASTRRTPTDRARLVAAEVLDAWPWIDPTGGAVEFWMPGEQSKLHALGDVYRASSAGGDAGSVRKMKSYARYADYGNEADVRAQYENDGLHVVGTVGSIELLGRMM